MPRRLTPAGWLEALLARHWWRPERTLLAQALRPLSWLAALLAKGAQLPYRLGWRHAARAPVPVVVVGNLIVGGAGKTPTLIAVVEVLRQAGWQPGVISRGHGRHGEGVAEVLSDSSAAQVGDEPLLIRRRTGVPVFVARRRSAAARALCARHPTVNVLVADDGLQHLALARDAEVIVFDARGAGNGLLLPAGPLRQRLPLVLAAGAAVLYNADAASTALPGALAARRLGPVLPLADWLAGRAAAAVPLETLRGRRLLAVAGVAAPERFFTMLEARGLAIDRLPLPDHHEHAQTAWPAGTADVITTEKDAVKLRPDDSAGTRIWVVGLDFELPAHFSQALLRRLGPPPATGLIT